MAKAFSLTFEYTPKWKGNRERAEGERITARLRDFTESKRIEILEKMRESIGDRPEGVDELKRLVEIKRKNLEFSLRVVKDYFVGIDNLSVQFGDDEVKPICTVEELCRYCEDLALELASRLTNGPDEQEIKN